MKRNIYDDALEGVGKIIERVSDNIAKDFKGVAPFDKKLISKSELMEHFNEMPLEERIRIFEELRRKE